MAMTMKLFQKVIACTLSITLLFQSLPVKTSAQTIDNKTPSAVSDSRLKIVDEETDKRTEYSKTFRLSDGSFEVAQYKVPIHYKDDSGKFEDINNSLSVNVDNTMSDNENTQNEISKNFLSKISDAFSNLKSFFGMKKEDSNSQISNESGIGSTIKEIAEDIKTGYENTKSDFKVKFANKLTSSALVRVKDGSQKISWSLENVSYNRNGKFVLSNNKPVNSSDSSKVENEAEFTTLKNIETGATYENILPNVDLQYELISKELKENIILKNSDAQNAFNFSYKLKNLKMKYSSDGSIDIYNPETNVVKYNIPKPVMYDSNGATTDSVAMTFKEEKGNYRISLEADKNWLEDSQRVYPIIIDPDLQTPLVRSQIHETFVASGTSSVNNNYTNWKQLYVGREQNLNIYRTYIKFELPKLNRTSRITAAQLNLYQYGCLSKAGTNATSVSNYEVDVHKVTGSLDTAKVTWKTQPAYESTIADYCMCSSSSAWRAWDVTKMVSDWYNTGNNTGLVLTAKNESTKTYLEYYSSDYPNLSSNAYPSIIFHYVDTNGMENYWTYHSQSAGRAGTGSINDFNGNVTLAEDNVCENGANGALTLNHVFNNASALDGTYANQAVKLGNGWRFNVGKRIKSSNITNYPYYLIDEDGTEHYFKNTSNVIKDEDGLGITLTTINDGQFNKQLTYKDGTVEKYDLWGYLRKSTDSNGVAISYNYSPIPSVDNYLSSVVDGSGRKTTLQYNSSHVLTSITDPSGRVTKYSYDNESTGAHLTAVTYPDGKSVHYTYSGDRIASMTNIDGYKVSYTSYDRSNRCTAVKETDSNGNVGNSLTIQYPNCNESKFTDAIKNKTETYQFDSLGQTVCLLGSDGNAAMYKYNSSGTGKYKVSDSSATQTTVLNYLANSGFEDALNSWVSKGNGISTKTGSLCGNTMLAAINSTVCDSYVEQKPSLKAGTYTLSGYIKATNVSSGSNGAALRIEKTSNGSTTYYYSEKIFGTTNTDVDNGWKRVSVTFTLASGETLTGIDAGLFGSSGTAYFDDLQLEKGLAANKYNLLDNSSIERVNGGTIYSWTGNHITGTSNTTSGKCSDGGDRSFYVPGEASITKSIYQTVNVSGSEGDIYSLSGWAKANAAPAKASRLFALVAKVYYTDGTTSQQNVKFNTAVSDWQYVSGIITTDDKNASTSKKYNKIVIYASYDYNLNTALFDGIQFTKDDGTSYIYDSNGNLISTTDANKNSSTFKYDGNNNLISSVSPTGASFTYTYDSKKNITSAKNNSNVTYSFTYDSAGNPLTSKINGGGLSMESESTYTSDKNYTATLKDSRGNTVSYDYGQNLSEAEYNKGLLRSETDANGNSTSYTYDPNTDVALSASTVLNKGKDNQKTVSNSYSYESDSLKTISHNGFNYNFFYDGFGNQTAVSIGDQNLIQNTYAANNGNLLSSSYGNGATVSNTYDSNDRITGKSYNGTNLFEWVYDALGNVASHIDRVNNVNYKYNYDFSGRLTSFTADNGFSVNYIYDKTSRLTSLKNTLGSTTHTTNYTYNSDNLPVSLTAGQNDSINYSYDGLNRLASKKFSIASSSVNTNISYLAGANGNTTNLISDYAISKNSADIHHYSYTYDKNGNILTISDSGTLKAKYTYDELNELTREDNAVLNKSIVYSYDAGGNITEKSEYAYTTGTLGSATAAHTYSYGDSSWKDKLTSYDGSNITYDAIGNPLSYIGGASFTWQNGRQLAAAAVSGHDVSYKYNSDGIRTSKTVDGVTTNYYIEGGNIAWQTDGTNTIHYTYDADGKLVYMNLNGSLYYYERNAQNDIVGLIDTNMNEVVTYSYDTWGKLLNIGGSLANTIGKINPFRYRGYYYDTETGLYYLQSRYYDANTGRFINADGYVSAGTGFVGLNMFGYANNNPVNMNDSSGSRATADDGSGRWVYRAAKKKVFKATCHPTQIPLPNANSKSRPLKKVRLKQSSSGNVALKQSLDKVSSIVNIKRTINLSVLPAFSDTMTGVRGTAATSTAIGGSSVCYAVTTPLAIWDHWADNDLSDEEKINTTACEIEIALGGILLAAFGPVGWTGLALSVVYTFASTIIMNQYTSSLEERNKKSLEYYYE
jgi:RHS repeat-associated protein